MSVAHPSFLHQFLQELQTKPKKSLSQNFLIDQNIVGKIVKSVALKEGETLLEIGPGPGALTELFAQSGNPLILVEKDHIFAEALRRFPRATLFKGDFFDFDLSTLPLNSKVVSNLPYHLTTPILTTLLPLSSSISTLTLMMQKEVAERLMAEPGKKNYGSITLFCRFYATIVEFFPVKASCFYPKPSVDSMVVTFQLKSPPEGIDEQLFFSIMRSAFGQRRKMLRVSLKQLCNEETFVRADLLPTARAEELTFEQYCALSKALFQK